ncbi:hypothetical protein QYE76_032324 [Lolium multiflorum]|uniref:Uncharacterized protein n=1 Tax=Lolium multiflorum TaxID=4521 RepID=A0AAD8QUV2_LOLMU|nr:hypothetical protein QYE76_032324 [Lolium multiflorum]
MRADLSTIQQTLTPDAAAALARAMDRRRAGGTSPPHYSTSPPHSSTRRPACSARPARRPRPQEAPPPPPVALARTHSLPRSRALLLRRARQAARHGGRRQGGQGRPHLRVQRARRGAQARAGPAAPGLPGGGAAAAPRRQGRAGAARALHPRRPSVSRVMREASFSSAAVKNTIEQSLTSPSPSSSAAASGRHHHRLPRFPRPLPLSRAPAPPAPTSTHASQRLPAAGTTRTRCSTSHAQAARRNPVIVGDAGPDAILEGNPENPDGQLACPCRGQDPAPGGRPRKTRRRQGGHG